MSIDWDAVVNELARWVRGASGLQPVWANQDGNYPAYPFCMLDFTSARPLGSTDEIIKTTDLNRPAGQEIELRVRTQYILTLSVHAYAENANVVGSNSAMATLMRVKSRLGLPSVRQRLRAVGLGLFAAEDVLDITGQFQAGWESHAHFDVRFLITEEQSDFVGYFNQIRGRLTLRPAPPAPTEYAVTGD